mgnify:CR=1 FL=1
MSYARHCLLDLLGPPGDEDDLIGQVEDDRAHAEAEKLREFAAEMVFNLLDPFGPQKEGWVRHIADRIDPYEMRGTHLVRKSDGKPIGHVR